MPWVPRCFLISTSVHSCVYGGFLNYFLPDLSLFSLGCTGHYKIPRSLPTPSSAPWEAAWTRRRNVCCGDWCCGDWCRALCAHVTSKRLYNKWSHDWLTDCDVAYNVSYECNFTYIFVHGSETMLIQGIVFGFVNTVVQVQSSWILFWLQATLGSTSLKLVLGCF